MKESLRPGVEGRTRHTVTADMSPRHLPRVVLSTPMMIQLVEMTCLQAAQEHLDDGETTVGTHVCVSHETAVFEGEEFEIVGRLTEVNRRRLTFDVEVTGPQGVVSRGTHERAVVSLDRMA
jgi:fluoroacetyl-CoA thioesterase